MNRVLLFLALLLLPTMAHAQPLSFEQYAKEHSAELREEVGTVRQDLAREIYNFLYGHALCVEGAEAPCDWIYFGAYELHWTARELYSSKDLKDIEMPVSEWKRGGYTPYYSPITYLQHESLMFRIYMLLRFGENGIPEVERFDRS